MLTSILICVILSHRVFFYGVQQHLLRLAQTLLHLHVVSGQLDGVERHLRGVLSTLHGLPEQSLCFLHVALATREAHPSKPHHGQARDCYLQGLQDFPSLVNLA